MNILFGCAETLNPIIGRLRESLAERPEVNSVQQRLEMFWRGASDIDVLHLHWPRALFENWRDPIRSELAELEDRLRWWKGRAPIVATVHNIHPHYRQNAPLFEDLYEIVYQAADGLIHMGRCSKELLDSVYDVEDAEATVIPHGSYDLFPNDVSKEEARQKLRIGESATVALVFGQLRDPEELALVLESVENWDASEKQALIVGRFGWTDDWLRTHATRWYNRLRMMGHPVHIEFGEIEDENVQQYLNAADLVLIPRKRVLNSGNVALGFTFGRVVVGPDVGVVGEVLRETGNPVFDPGSTDSVAQALARGTELQRRGKGEENAEYARTQMNWDKISREHVDFYTSVVR